MRKTKKLVLCSILSAIGVALLLLGAVLELIDVSIAFIVALIPLFCLAEFGIWWSIGVYVVISSLSLLIVGPGRFAVICFILITGLWPVLKYLFEKLGKVWAWIVKILYANAMFFVLYFFFTALLDLPELLWLRILYLVLGNVVFVMADIMYGQLLKLYFFKFRERISKYLK